MRCRNNFSKKFFTPYAVREWNKLNNESRSSTSYEQFRKFLLSFIKPTCSTLFSFYHPVLVKLLVRDLVLAISVNINLGATFMIL